MIEKEYIKYFSDIYKLNENRLLTLDLFAEKASKNLFLAINESRKITSERFIYAIGIPNVGEEIARALVRCFKNLDKLINAEFSDFDEIKGVKGVGKITAKKIFTKLGNIKRFEIHDYDNPVNYLTTLKIGIGEETANRIMRKFGTLDKLSEAKEEELLNNKITKIDGVGEKIAENIIQYFSDKNNLSTLKKLKGELDKVWKNRKIYQQG